MRTNTATLPSHPWLRFASVVIFVAVAGTNGVTAPHGVLDTTFDGDGRQTIDFGLGSAERANGVVVQPDGRIVMAGSLEGAAADFAVARLNPNGSLDMTFSDDARANFNLGGTDVAQAVALQPDGKIVVAGFTNTGPGAPSNNFAVIRLLANGTLDPGFGVAGAVTIDFSGDDRAMAVAVQDDGKIVVAGSGAGAIDFALARLNPNGSLDTAFSGDGKVAFSFGADDFGQAVAVEKNGRIVVAGRTEPGGISNFAIARVTASGTMDSSFGTGVGPTQEGRVRVNFGGDDRATSVALQLDGKILVGGTTDTNFALVRLDTAGALDVSFNPQGGMTGLSNGNGRLSFSVGGADVSTGLALTHSGKIVMSGYTTAGRVSSDNDFAVAVVNPDGSKDTTFDTDGELLVDFGADDMANAVAIQPDGQIVLAGVAKVDSAPAGIDFAVARIGADPPLDLTFDGDGRQTTNFGNTDDRGNAVVVQPDGKVIVVGTFDTGVSPNLAIARYNVNGTLDATFSGDGRHDLSFQPLASDDFGHAVALQADGKIVVAGATRFAAATDFGVARFNRDGTPDSTFDVDGRLAIDFGGVDSANGVAIQADGNIVIVGSAGGNFSNFAIARLLPNGAVDTSFSGDGRVDVGFGLGSTDIASSVVVQPDGNIVVGGRTTSLGGDSFALLRLTPAGLLDTTFDGDGRVTTVFGLSGQIHSLALQVDGKIVAAGSSDAALTLSDFDVARYNPNGTLDTSFSGDGVQNVAFGQTVLVAFGPSIGGRANFARGVALQPNGKIVLAGYSNAGSGLGPNDVAIARLNADGSLDNTFNVTGRLLIDFGDDDRAHGVAIHPATGAIVAAGFTSRNGGDFAVLRLPGDVPPPLPGVTFNDVTALETTGAPAAMSFTLTLSAASVFPVTIDVQTVDGSATAPADYEAIATSVLFPPGATTRTITVSIVGDAVDEPVETLRLSVFNAGNATIVQRAATGTINDNDLTVTITAPTSAPTLAVNTSFINMAGTAADAVGIANVTWVSDRGASGTATGTTSWTIASVPILSGINVITVTARDVAGNPTTDTLTVTLSTLIYYLAEGATGPFFDYDLLLANPNAVAAPIAITFLRDDGVTVSLSRLLLPTSRTTIRVDDVPGLTFTAVSAVVTSTSALPIIVERSMYWDAKYYGGHAGSSVPQPGTSWLFGEGSQGFFDTFVLLANSNAAPVNVTVRFLPETGAPVVKTHTVGATSRFNVYAGAIPELVGRSFSIVVQASAPIIAERAMYFGSPLFNGGHESAGVPAASTTWFHAEGATGPFFDTFILVGNPNAGAATVTMTFLRDTGATVVKTKVIPGNTRLTVNVEAEDPTLANTAVSTTVTSDLPVISERAMYWPGVFTSWFEAHNSFGVTETATKWGLAEGRLGGPFSFETYILLANPSTTTAAEVKITYLKTDGTTVVKTYTVTPTTRFNVSVKDAVPELIGQQFGALIEVTNGIPIAVERAVYNNAGGVIWAAGTNATAVRVP